MSSKLEQKFKDSHRKLQKIAVFNEQKAPRVVKHLEVLFTALCESDCPDTSIFG